MVRIAASPVAVVCALAALTGVAQAAAIKHLVHRDAVPPPPSAVSARELDAMDVYTRALLDDANLPRTLEETFERSWDDGVDVDAREVAEAVFERGARLRSFAKKAFGVAKGVAKFAIGMRRDGDALDGPSVFERGFEDADLFERALEDLLERELNGDLYERESFEEDLSAREFWDDEAEARDFGDDLD